MKNTNIAEVSALESRCFVVIAGMDVVANYCLPAGAISHEASPKAMRRNMPNPLPVCCSADCLSTSYTVGFLFAGYQRSLINHQIKGAPIEIKSYAINQYF